MIAREKYLSQKADMIESLKFSTEQNYRNIFKEAITLKVNNINIKNHHRRSYVINLATTTAHQQHTNNDETFGKT
ncbi:MAG: hypothetical protein Q8N88_02145 [Nanoarchaeota archaeon]|nr:hypothetical protein [Nanoarchaeota archaeon]